jgi:hypothetical protein
MRTRRVLLILEGPTFVSLEGPTLKNREGPTLGKLVGFHTGYFEGTLCRSIQVPNVTINANHENLRENIENMW